MFRPLLLPSALLAFSFTLVTAQNPTNVTPDDSVSTVDTAMPTTSDHAPSNQSDSGSTNSASLYSYYLIFIALIVCVAGVAGYITYRRKRKYGAFMQQSRESALQRDLHAWDPTRARRRYWQGRWRSTDVDHEEGLNENGEAPPPYVPKTREEEQQEQVTVPMQTLSRDQAGLKPPDYTEVGERLFTSTGEGATSSGSMTDRSPRGGTMHSGT